MNPEIYTATQGLIARQNELDLIANNLANVNTSGFKATKPFVYAFNQALEGDLMNPLNAMNGSQPVLTGEFLNQEQGGLKNTGGPLDIALEGTGFFKLETPYGTRYTRRGHFQLDRNGALSTEQGYFVLDQRGQRIILGEGPVDISKDGAIFQDKVEKGRLAVVELPNPENLVPEEDLLIASMDPNQQEIPARATMSQGFLEMSNVSVAREMIAMIQAQRVYEMNNKVIKAINQDLNQNMIRTFSSVS